jgi:hypothetical protein
VLEQALSSQTVKVLIEAAQLPWVSCGTLAVRSGLATEDAHTVCNTFLETGLMQKACVALLAYPKTLYAPTERGVCVAADALNLRPEVFARLAHLTEQRFWALRAGWETAQEINAIGARTQNALAPALVDWETFVERRHKRRVLFLDGRIAVTTNNGVQTFYVLLARDSTSPWHWYRTLKYLQAWAARSAGAFPPALVIARRALDVQIILSVNHMAGGAQLFATFDRYAALDSGLSQCEWHTLRPDCQIVLADPLQLPAVYMAEAAASVHRVRRLEVPNDLQLSAHLSTGPARWGGGRLEHLPAALVRLPAVDQLDDASYGALTFLVTHPVCPTATLAAFNHMAIGDAMTILVSLQNMGFVELVEENTRDARWAVHGGPKHNLVPYSSEARCVFDAVHKQPNMRVVDIARVTRLPVAQAQSCLDQLKDAGCVENVHRQPEHQLWAAADTAVSLVAARTMQPADRMVQRHRFFRADHTRRSQHTRETYAFFETLHEHCTQRSRAAARFDAGAAGVGEAVIPFYELVDFESEINAAAWYVFHGQARFWRPDGFGLLRAGHDYTSFWLEMDGTTTTRSHRDAVLWEDKLGRMCDYLASEHWRLKHDAFPGLLIVSSAVRQRAMIAEALAAAAQSRSITPPQVFITGHEALAQRGPLGPIWFSLMASSRRPTYAFEGVTPHIVQTAALRRNLLDDLDYADRIGLIDLATRQGN